MPAVIGVAFVFVVGVVIWVVISADDDDSPASIATATTLTVQPSAIASSTDGSVSTAVTTSPTPLPSVPPTSAPPSTAPAESSTTSPTPPAPPTTAPGAEDGAVPGDLAVPGRPMQRPPCDGGYITVLASPIGSQATGPGVGAVLGQYPGSEYLRTDQTCPSLRPDADGDPIYVIFYGPFAFDTDACTAREDGPGDAYVRRLSDELGPDHSVSCT